MVNEIFNQKILPIINLILQGDIKTIIVLFLVLFIMGFVFTIYADIHSMLKEVKKTLDSYNFINTSKHMIVPIVSLYGLFESNYPVRIMNDYSFFVKIIFFIWSLLLIEYFFIGIIYIFKTKGQREFNNQNRIKDDENIEFL